MITIVKWFFTFDIRTKRMKIPKIHSSYYLIYSIATAIDRTWRENFIYIEFEQPYESHRLFNFSFIYFNCCVHITVTYNSQFDVMWCDVMWSNQESVFYWMAKIAFKMGFLSVSHTHILHASTHPPSPFIYDIVLWIQNGTEIKEHSEN